MRRRRVLLVDDDRFFCDLVKDHLNLDVDVRAAHTATEARAILATQPPDLLVVDQILPDGSGLDLISELHRQNDSAKAVVVTGFPTIESAVQALKDGVYDYLTKPVTLEDLRRTVANGVRRIELEHVEQVARYQHAVDEAALFMVGVSEAWRKVSVFAEQAAKSDTPALITGESGTGKTLLARTIHYQSPRRRQPFLSINCGALPESLAEAELFGVERGAYTGATGMRKGLFELADGGTLFLDELGELSLASQAKLLAAIEDGVVRRLGGAQQHRVDVRVLAATSVRPETAMAQQRLRRDLYYRLAVLEIEIPPLAARLEDLPALCEHLLRKLAPGKRTTLAPGELATLSLYHWPGNVRELRNVLERALLVQGEESLRPSALLEIAHQVAEPTASAPEPVKTLADFENGYILQIFELEGRNLTRAAQRLGISLSTLRLKLRALGVPPQTDRRISAGAGSRSPFSR
jgi:DNA-binding NtrC family response regulator